MGMQSGGMMGGSAPAQASNALSDFGPGPTEPKREPMASGPSASNFEASFGETSKLRAQLRAAEEMERRAKKATTELRTQVDDMQRNMNNMQEQMEQFQKQAQGCMMEAAQAKQQVAPLMAENQQLREGVAQWQEQCNRQQAEIERLNDEIAQLQDKVEKLSDVERSQNTFQERVAEAEKRAMNAEEQMAAIERELFAVNRERDALKADVDFYQSKSSGAAPPRPAPVAAAPEPSQPSTSISADGGWGASDLDLFGTAAPAPQPPKPKPRLLTQEEIDSFKKGDQVIRKGEQCTIMKIDHSLEPPGCTVKVNSTGQIVGTELHLVQKVGAPAPVSAPAPAAVPATSEGLGGLGFTGAFSQDLSPAAPVGNTAPMKVGEPSPMTQPVSNPPLVIGSPQKKPTQQPAAPAPAPQKPKEPSNDGLLPLNQQSVNMYEEYFTQADANGDGMVDGGEAFQFFSKSSLPRKALAAIWTLIDNPKKGKLTKAQFFSMFHIVMTIKQNPSFVLPKQLPDILRPERIEALIPKKEPTTADGDDWDNFDAGF